MQRVAKQLGEYRILAQLAKGGQSTVYLAARSGPHGFFRPVVIKAIPDDFKGKPRLEALFYQEATLSSRFSHPHVVTVHDAKRAGDDHFMVMDYVAGQTVADLAQRAFAAGQGITLEETLLILADACRGLEYVHTFQAVEGREFNIVHCDISPQNLMVTYSGLTRVFDFGISQVLGHTDSSSTELVGGKYAYMSPEQCRDEELDTRSDIFSLGIILYELATGQRLFRRKGEEAVREAILNEPIEAPSKLAGHLNEEIDRVILKALARDRDQRYQSAADLEEDIQQLLSKQGVRRDELRNRLGQKVSELFGDERAKVGQILDEARGEMAAQDGSLQESADKESSKREAKLKAQLAEVQEEADDLRRKAQRATEVASALSREVKNLQKRQHWLTFALFAMSMVAVAVAGVAFLSQ